MRYITIIALYIALMLSCPTAADAQKVTKKRGYVTVEFQPVNVHLSDTTLTVVPSIVYKNARSKDEKYDAILKVDNMRHITSIKRYSVPRFGDIRLVTSESTVEQLFRTPRYKSVAEATAALYDIITTRVLLDTRHPERSKVDIHDGCVRFYDMEWSDRMSLLLKMGLISMDEVTSFPKHPEDK